MNSETKFHVGVMDARLKKVKKQCDQYKKAYQHCVDDLIVLRANNKRLERENECEKEWFYKYSCELEHIVKHERDTIKRLERENEQYIKLLKEFNNLINYKLAIHPGSDVYMYYRSELNKLGVK
ncbi:hypothetical protein [Staphylococcus sp. GDY8P131P]|uniref:hypothetical protein n=1 Tax=Staphylococcus sp. GDY8P131P TaxID=2804159 RepID=UPI001AEBE846|nr:hypothetical protein [Staphylococcus sp. GDY8P131P]